MHSLRQRPCAQTSGALHRLLASHQTPRVTGGAQPMASPDRRVWITFNGEIFNYEELRPRLEARGRRFTTRSDTEVLLACYELDGIAGLRAPSRGAAETIVPTRMSTRWKSSRPISSVTRRTTGSRRAAPWVAR